MPDEIRFGGVDLRVVGGRGERRVAEAGHGSERAGGGEPTGRVVRLPSGGHAVDADIADLPARKVRAELAGAEVAHEDPGAGGDGALELSARDGWRSTGDDEGPIDRGVVALQEERVGEDILAGIDGVGTTRTEAVGRCAGGRGEQGRQHDHDAAPRRQPHHGG